jgi:GNAT superfamily N-acetyltransferase
MVVMILSSYRLQDGTPVLVRPIRADDKRLLSKAFARLSPETVRKRFLAPKKGLTTAELKYLTEIDGSDHVAVVAVMADKPWMIVGVGRYVRLAEDPETADVAIVIGDPWQHQGLGRHLGAILADIAREHGIEHFSATLLSDNVAAHRLFATISQRLRGHHSHGVEELVVDLAA